MNVLLLIVISSTALLLGYILDRRLGDPYSYHPIVGMGYLIAWGECRLNKGRHRGLKGGLYNAVLIAIALIFPLLLEVGLIIWEKAVWSLILYWILGVIGSFYMLSGTTLIREVRGVFDALELSLEQGRAQVGRIVGRDTNQLSRHEVQTAALETLSENLNDGVVAPLVWYALLGMPGMVAYKMINTQDSMIGYRNERYKDYGCFSAKVDDVVNWIPARLTALLMLISAHRLDLVGFVARYGREHASPNSGYPEAALAGILDCRFGGVHDYFGQSVYKPYIGDNPRALSYEDMQQAIRINRRVEVLALGIAIVLRICLLGVSYSLISSML